MRHDDDDGAACWISRPVVHAHATALATEADCGCEADAARRVANFDGGVGRCRGWRSACGGCEASPPQAAPSSSCAAPPMRADHATGERRAPVDVGGDAAGRSTQAAGSGPAHGHPRHAHCGGSATGHARATAPARRWSRVDGTAPSWIAPDVQGLAWHGEQTLTAPVVVVVVVALAAGGMVVAHRVDVAVVAAAVAVAVVVAVDAAVGAVPQPFVLARAKSSGVPPRLHPGTPAAAAAAIAVAAAVAVAVPVAVLVAVAVGVAAVVAAVAVGVAAVVAVTQAQHVIAAPQHEAAAPAGYHPGGAWPAHAAGTRGGALPPASGPPAAASPRGVGVASWAPTASPMRHRLRARPRVARPEARLVPVGAPCRRSARAHAHGAVMTTPVHLTCRADAPGIAAGV